MNQVPLSSPKELQPKGMVDQQSVGVTSEDEGFSHQRSEIDQPKWWLLNISHGFITQIHHLSLFPSTSGENSSTILMWPTFPRLFRHFFPPVPRVLRKCGTSPAEPPRIPAAPQRKPGRSPPWRHPDDLAAAGWFEHQLLGMYGE